MQQPLRDSDGTVIPHDHNEILNEHEIIRRISDQYLVIDSTGKRISSSMAFKASSGKNGGMSIDLKYQIEQAGLDAKKYVTTPKWIGSVLLKVSDIRNLGFQVGYDPSRHNKYHGEVWGTFSRSTIEKLRKCTEWFVAIDDVNLI